MLLCLFSESLRSREKRMMKNNDTIWTQTMFRWCFFSFLLLFLWSSTDKVQETSESKEEHQNFWGKFPALGLVQHAGGVAYKTTDSYESTSACDRWGIIVQIQSQIIYWLDIRHLRWDSGCLKTDLSMDINCLSSHSHAALLSSSSAALLQPPNLHSFFFFFLLCRPNRVRKPPKKWWFICNCLKTY